MRARRHGTHQAPLEPGGIRETRAPLLGLNRVRPPFWPPSEIPRSVVDPFTTVLILSGGRPVFTADYYFVDGVTGKVASFIDWNDVTHLAAQSASARQVAVPAAHADFNNQLCATFAAAQMYESNRATSAWQFASDGVSCESFRVFTPTSVALAVIDCTTQITNQPGYQMYVGVTANKYGAYLGKSGGAAVAATDLGAAVAGTPTYVSLRYKSADANQYEYRLKTTLGSSGTFAAAPSAAAANCPLRIGAAAVGSVPFSGRWRATAFFPALSAASEATVQAWIATMGVS